MAHSCAATSYSISFVNSGFCSSSTSHSRALSLRFAPLQSRKLRLKGTEKRFRFDPVKAVYLDSEKSYRKGYWSIRDDLAIPSTPYIPMSEVYAGQGPPPMVIEGLRSLTSQLFQHRIVRCGGEVNDDMANLLVAQLLLLDALDPNKDITMYINSPGGSVTAGLAIYDTMRHVRPNVSTICVGLAASMGAFLLSGGTKGKRFSLPSARIMIHQPLGGAQGRETEIEAQVNEMMHHKANLNTHIALNCGRELRKVYEDTERDYFMSPKEAKEYGLIDDVIINPIKSFQPVTAKSP